MTDPARLRPHPAARRESGFTLAETLLASVLGAMLLTAVAVSTFGFTHNLDYLETKAGVGSGIDPVLRRMTRDIREAWWVEKVGPSHLRIAAPDGSLTEYWLAEGQLFLQRPNGDVGVVYTGLDSLTLDTNEIQRKREATPVDNDGVWYSSGSADTPVAVVVPASGALALGFVTPTIPAELPGGSTADEQVLAVASSVVTVAVSYITGTGTKYFHADLYPSWAPGRARPTGNPIASAVLPRSALPIATSTGSVWDIPAVDLSFSLPATLEPGVGYTLVLYATGASQIVVKGGAVIPAVDADQVALQSSMGGSFVVQPLMVPYTIQGPYQLTATDESQVVNRVSLTAYPTGEQPQHRSASILSQSYSNDPWLGVVPGETAD